MTVTLQKWGNSQGIRIPKNVLEDMGWSENEVLEINKENNVLTLTKAKKPKTIKDLFDGYEEDYTCTEINWGKPEGREIW